MQTAEILSRSRQARSASGNVSQKRNLGLSQAGSGLSCKNTTLVKTQEVFFILQILTNTAA